MLVTPRGGFSEETQRKIRWELLSALCCHAPELASNSTLITRFHSARDMKSVTLDLGVTLAPEPGSRRCKQSRKVYTHLLKCDTARPVHFTEKKDRICLVLLSMNHGVNKQQAPICSREKKPRYIHPSVHPPTSLYVHRSGHYHRHQTAGQEAGIGLEHSSSR
ncbi:uncharacterized protein V6R79_007089 [Siganus canaliculatus]